MARFRHVHPIERLRYVARTGWAGPAELAVEAAWALADLAEREAPALVPACRLLLRRQPGCGPLWWVAARVLGSGDPVGEAESCAQELVDDPTGRLVDNALGDGLRAVRRGGIGEVAGADVVLLEVYALGPTGMVADGSAASLLEAARAAEVPVWVEAGVGRVMPARLWEAMARRLVEPRRQPGEVSTAGSGSGLISTSQLLRADLMFGGGSPARPGVLLEHEHVVRAIGPGGAMSLAGALGSADCPEPPELLEGL
jgi:hypothetical protein